MNAALDAHPRLMVIWFAFGSIFAVWNVFQSPGLDFRLIALGALLPLAPRRAVRRAGVRAHVALGRGRCSRSRCSPRPGAAAGCGAGARSASRSAGSRASCSAARGRTRKCSGGPRSASSARTRRCSRPGPSSSCRAARARGRGVDLDAVRPRRPAPGARVCSVPGASRRRFGDGRRMIAFVRHGQTAANRDGRFQGRIDPPLTDVGREQVARVAERFAATRITRVVASPLTRARRHRGRDRADVTVSPSRRRAADRARLRRVGRRWRSPTSPPDEWARWRADPDVRAARRRELVRRRPRGSPRSAPSVSSDELTRAR